jgi:hypothetical protein
MMTTAIDHIVFGIDAAMTQSIDQINIILQAVQAALDENVRPDDNTPTLELDAKPKGDALAHHFTKVIHRQPSLADMQSTNSSHPETTIIGPDPHELIPMMHDSVPNELDRPQLVGKDGTLRHMHAQVFHHLQTSKDHILQDVHEYKRVRTDLILMMRNSLHDNDDQIMRAMDEERNRDITEALHLELQGQRVQDDDLHQLNDDILHHTNAMTDEIIDSFENLRHDSHNCQLCGEDHNSDEDCSVHEPTNELNEASAWWVEPHDSSEDTPNSLDDDINENTDTEDGAADIADLIQVNTKLLNFLTKQSATIARLRARIVRLSTLVQDLTTRLEEGTDIILQELVNQIDGPKSNTECVFQFDREAITRGLNAIAIDEAVNTKASQLQSMSSSTDIPDSIKDDSALVLVDTQVDTSFLLKPNSDAKVDITRLDHPKIQNQLQTQMAKIQDNKNSTNELWMYFDSGASRSVISTTSPIRKHIQSIGPAYGSCSIGDGTPLNYLEKGNVTETLEVTVVTDLRYDLFSAVSAAK